MDKKRERLFGTDGIRGTPGEYPLSDGMVFKIGFSIARFLNYKRKSRNKKIKVVIGKDTRLSGNRIETILVNTLASIGVDALSVGIMPTAAVAVLVKKVSADMGIVISASHNKPTDNGIKFFNSRGHKISIRDEEWIEDIIFNNLIHSFDNFDFQGKGNPYCLRDGTYLYSQFLKSAVGDLDLKDLKICLDCAGGASSLIAKNIFQSLNAKIHSIHDTFQGEHINKGGAVNAGFLRQLVLKTNSDVGFAYDGDGDRVILVDEKGNILDGDYLLAILSTYFLGKKKLTNKTIVTTHMSNCGLKVAMDKAGIRILSTNVGDKYVLEALLENELNLGGEQSGHIILLDYSPCPDGLLTSLFISKILKESKKTLSELSSCMTKLPQILVNVKVREKKPLESIPSILNVINSSNAKLKNEGRILVRYSGTEPLARIMVEGKDKSLVTEIAHNLASHIKQALGSEEDGVYI